MHSKGEDGHAVAQEAGFLACHMEARLVRTSISSITRLLAPVAATAVLAVATTAWAQNEQPNILVIWGDDIGQSNISAYTMGVVGYRTPNIDRIAEDGMIFTDYYGEQSCTAGRSSFITGQSVFRTGLSKVGLPGAELGMQVEDPTIAGLLKPLGYVTGQFGKNHLRRPGRAPAHESRLR